MKRKYIYYAIFAVILALLTFFGLGPALFADGSQEERLYNLLVVLGLYLILVYAFFYVRKRLK